MDLGVHLPLMQFGEEPLSLVRLRVAVDTARECGFAAVSANDHFVFQTAWLDGPTALASMIERSGQLTLATTLSLAVLRGPVPLAKALAAIDILSEGRLVAAVAPGSSKRDYDALGPLLRGALGAIRRGARHAAGPTQWRTFAGGCARVRVPGVRRRKGRSRDRRRQPRR